MIGSFLQKIGSSAQPFIPAASVFIFILFSAVPLPLPYIGSIAPALGLAAIYYWAIYRPDLLRPTAVFVLGVLSDVIHYLPIGLTALVFIAVYQLALSQRRFFVKQIFFMLWLGFGAVSFLSSLVNWTVMSFYESTMLPFIPVLMQFLMTLMFFPLPAWLLIKVQHRFLSQG